MTELLGIAALILIGTRITIAYLDWKIRRLLDD